MMNEKASKPSHGRTLQGVVLRCKMEKTVIVKIMRRVKHPLYGKVVTKSNNLHVHDEANQCQVGDVVLIRPSRPLSKMKAWILVKLLEKARR